MATEARKMSPEQARKEFGLNIDETPPAVSEAIKQMGLNPKPMKSLPPIRIVSG